MTQTVPDAPTYPISRSCPFGNAEQFAELRAHEPVSRVNLTGGGTAWLVTRHDLTRQLLADPRVSSDRTHPNFPIPVPPEARESFRRRAKTNKSLIGMDQPEHTTHRRMVINEFTVKRVQALTPRIQQIVDDLIDDMLAAENHPVDLVEALSLPVPSLVICELLGVPYTDRSFFQARTKMLITRSTAAGDRERAGDELNAYMSDLVHTKEAAPGDDLLGRMIVKYREAGSYDHNRMCGLALLLLIAGHETTANMISLGTVALLEHPDQRAKMLSEEGMAPRAIEELLRYFSIVESATARVAKEDIELDGVTIPADEGIIIVGSAANWDENAFSEPLTLDLDRGARHHVAFGYGVHQCLGQNLARTELEIVYATLFRRIPDLRLAIPSEDIPYKADASIFGIHALPVTWGDRT